jgi:hypothetical protein
MERLIILVLWGIGAAVMRSANNKNNEGKTKKGTCKQKRKSVFGTFMEDLEKEMQGEKEKQRLEGPIQWAKPARPAQTVRPVKPAQPSILSDFPKQKDPPKPAAPTKPVGLEIDYIGGDEEIGGIKEAGMSKGSKNNIGLDLKRDILKGIIYSEILSEPKSLRIMKRRCQQ